MVGLSDILKARLKALSTDLGQDLADKITASTISLDRIDRFRISLDMAVLCCLIEMSNENGGIPPTIPEIGKAIDTCWNLDSRIRDGQIGRGTIKESIDRLVELGIADRLNGSERSVSRGVKVSGSELVMRVDLSDHLERMYQEYGLKSVRGAESDLAK